MTLEQAKALKSNIHATFDTPQGKETMAYLERICSWYPTIYESNDTNEIIGRDANRRIIGTIKSIMKLSPEQIVRLQEGE